MGIFEVSRANHNQVTPLSQALFLSTPAHFQNGIGVRRSQSSAGLPPKIETVDKVTLCSERSSKVSKKQLYTREFRQMAVGRMKVCDNVTTLAKELRVPRQLLYVWRDREEAITLRQPSGAKSASSAKEEKKEVQRLKRLLAEKALEVDFFKGALQKFEARRQASSSAGETPSI